MRKLWVDLRAVEAGAYDAVRQAALHGGAAAIIDSDADRLGELPTSVERVFADAGIEDWAGDATALPDPGGRNADHLLVPVGSREELRIVADLGPGYVPSVRVSDETSLDIACAAAARSACTMVEFTDPTKIPLEIVIAAAEGNSGDLICRVGDLDEAVIVLGVLEKGSEGVLAAPTGPQELLDLAAAVQDRPLPLDLVELTVTSIEHVGLGDRVCVDTNSHFEPDEGILVGSFAHGFVLCCSETHKLPYMPTRPFRVNAGALHSYVFQGEDRTNYLSELASGMPVLGVRADGSVRQLAVGRAKLERRPMLQINATGPGGESVALTVQDDWHVRVLGPGGVVLNVTELRSGDRLVGHLATERRHVGFPVDEFCVEK